MPMICQMLLASVLWAQVLLDEQEWEREHVVGWVQIGVVFGLVWGRAENSSPEPTPTCNPDPLFTGRDCGYATTGSATGAG